MGVWEVDPEIITAIDKALATMAVAGAFAVTPMLPFVEPTSVASGGFLVALGAGMRFIGQQLPARWSIASAAAGVALFAFAASIIIPAARHGEESAKANAQRCLAIQRDMLRAQPHRADSPELFQALGCHPQGQGSVYARSPSTRSPAR